MSKVVYLAHPVGGDVPGNLKSIERWFLWVVRSFNVAVCVPWYLYVLKLDDELPADRQRGMRDDATILMRCDELWLCGDRVSPGMRAEAEVARQYGMPIKNLLPHAPLVARGEYLDVGAVLDRVETLPK